MRRSARPGLLRWQLAGRPLIRRGKKGLREALAAEAAAEVRRLAAAAAADLAGGGSLEAVELALRAGLAQLGGRLLEGLLAADTGHRGPAVECGAGHQARFVSYRGKAVDTVPGPVRVRRAWYHCHRCGHGLAPRDIDLGVAGQVMSPGLRKMAARAAAAVPFAKAAALVGELAGIRLTGKRAGRSAEADGAAATQLVQAQAAAIAARALVPMPPPEPAPGKLYIAIDGTGVPMVAAETEGRDGKGDDGRARTREVKLCAVFTQATLDEDGRPVRDPGSSSYLATFDPAREFGVLMAAEAHRRGAGHIRQLVILGDGAVWIWNLADQHFPEATQIVDLYHAREHVHDLATLATRQPPRLAHPAPGRTRQRRHPRPARRRASPEIHRLPGPRPRPVTGLLRNQRPPHALRPPPFAGHVHRLRRGRGRLQSGHRPAPQALRHALDRPRRRQHRHPAMPGSQQPLGRDLATAAQPGTAR